MCRKQGVGQPCDSGGLAGGSINTTLVSFSVTIPAVPSTRVFRHVSVFPSPPSTPAPSLRSGVMQRHASHDAVSQEGLRSRAGLYGMLLRAAQHGIITLPIPTHDTHKL